MSMNESNNHGSKETRGRKFVLPMSIMVLSAIFTLIGLAVSIIVSPIAISAMGEYFQQRMDPSIVIMIFIFAVLFTMGIIVYVIALNERAKRKQRILVDKTNYHGSYDEERETVEDKIGALTSELISSKKRWDELYHLVLSSNSKSTSESGKPEPELYFSKFDINPNEVDEKLVFILTPFSDSIFDDYLAIRSECNENGFHALRGDENSTTGSVFAQTIQMLSKSRLIIANIYGRNPNVFFELGIAHSMNKTTILVSRRKYSEKEIPFDIHANRIIFYDSIDELRNKLRMALRQFAGINDDIVYNEMKDNSLKTISMKVRKIIDIYNADEGKEQYVIDLLRPIFINNSKAQKLLIKKVVNNGVSVNTLGRILVNTLGKKNLPVLYKLLSKIDDVNNEILLLLESR